MRLRKRLWIVLGLCALLAACQSGRPAPPPAIDYPVGLDRAERMIERHELDAARDLLATLTTGYPAEPAAWRLLGGLYDLQQQPGQAMAAFEQGLAAVPAQAPGYADLVLQAALTASAQPALGRDPNTLLEQLPPDDPRREIVAAAVLLRFGNAVKVLRSLNGLLKQSPPPATRGDIYFLAAQAYRHLDEPQLVNESLFHAVNFATSPVLVYRIEQLWKATP